MKIDYASDLHLEFDRGESDATAVFESFMPETLSETLVLAGDILEVNHCIKFPEYYTAFFDFMSERYENIFVLAGNHEYYNSVITDAEEKYQKFLERWGNVNFVQAESFYLGEDVYVLGSTLWTDMWDNPINYMVANRAMRDFHVILNPDGSRFQAADSTRLFRFYWNWIVRTIKDLPESAKVVLVSHHSPHMHTNTFAASTLNPAFHSNSIKDLLLNMPKIKAWIHGHTHERYEYVLNKVLVACNPRGYNGYEPVNGYKFKTIEV